MNWQTDFTHFMLDGLSFIEEQIEQTQVSAADQYAAVHVAAGIMPMIESRLQGHDYLIAAFQ
jgi:hypothetical protein